MIKFIKLCYYFELYVNTLYIRNVFNLFKFEVHNLGRGRKLNNKFEFTPLRPLKTSN